MTDEALPQPHNLSVHRTPDPSGHVDRRGPATTWLIACTGCEWHVHGGYPSKAEEIFAAHIKELAERESAFHELVAAVEEKLAKRHPEDVIRYGRAFGWLVANLDPDDGASREQFVAGIVQVFDHQDVDFEVCHKIVHALRGLYVFLEAPRTKKTTPDLITLALFGEDGPNYESAPPPTGALEAGEH